MVVHNVGKIVGGEAVGFEQHLVIELLVFDLDVPVDVVLKSADALHWHALTHDRHDAFGDAGFHLLRAQVAAGIAVAFHAFVGCFESGFVFFAAETVVGMPAREQFFRVFFINGQTLALHIGSKPAVLIRTFIVADASQCEPAVDRGKRFRDVAVLVGILDAEDELPMRLFRDEVGVEGSAEVADVHVARWAGSEARSKHSYFLLCWYLAGILT